ncbi:hypothetical protein ACWKWZ_23205 [Metapseudomonas otitidis]|nr:hypothetical protein [Pseudomonas aeruginosa]HBO3334075.1 hypothetical protein [Pseudomonas aeruginosa]
MIRPYMHDIGIGRYMPVILLAAFTVCAWTVDEHTPVYFPKQLRTEVVTAQNQQGGRLKDAAQAVDEVHPASEQHGLLEQILAQLYQPA